MPSTGAAKARIKTAYAVDAVIKIRHGKPKPADVYITRTGTVQFINKDETNWRIRLWTRSDERHADVDLFLPARSAITVIVDPETPEHIGECRYEVLDATFAAKNAKASKAKHGGEGAIKTGGDGTAGGGGAAANSAPSGTSGGKIRIGP